MDSEAQMNHQPKAQVKKNVVLQSDLELQKIEELDIAPAKWEVALSYKKKYSVQKELPDKTKEDYPLCAEVDELSKYGVGITLFFDFLKYIIILFFLMALVSIPTIYSNWSGQGLNNNGVDSNNFSPLTIANQPQLIVIVPADNATDDEKTIIQQKNDQYIKDWINEMDQRQKYVVIPDLIYSIIFFFFCLWYRKRQAQIKNQVLEENILPSHYTIQISNFPSTILNEEDLKNHLEPLFGDIAQCKLVRQYYGTLFYHAQAADLIFKLKVERKKLQIKNQSTSRTLQQLQKQLLEVGAKTSLAIKNNIGKTIQHDQYPSLFAYVTFQKINDRNACLKFFKKYEGFCADTQPKKYWYQRKYQLNASERIDEPSNINWENLDVTTGNRRSRLCCVYLIVLVIMLATFFIIIIANIVKPINADSCPRSSISLAQAQSGSQQIKECFCRKQRPDDIYNNKEIKEQCWDIYLDYLYTQTLIFVTSFVVMIVNFTMKVIFNKLATFSRYPTVTAQAVGTSTKLFVAQFINTGIITLILQANIFGFIPSIIISNIIPPIKEMQQDKESKFSADFDRAWYSDVGNKITFTMLIQIISPHLISLIFQPLISCCRLRKARNQVVQKQMNEFIIGPVFDLTSFYALAFNTIFTTLFYASGIPVLLWFAAFSLLFQYWVAKYFLLRYNKRPPAYDHQLNKQMLLILPYALLIHLAVGMYMYGQPLIFPKSSDNVNNSVTSNLNQAGVSSIFVGSQESQQIISRAYSIPYYLAFFFIVIVILIANATVYQWLKIFCKCLFCIKKDQQVAPIKKFGTYQEEYQRMSNRMIATYDIRLNDKYTGIIKAIDIGQAIDEKTNPTSRNDEENKLKK